MAKLPDNRKPYDPAKAMRDRNNQENVKEPVQLSLQQRMALKRPVLRPQKPLLREKN
jgi:hypothetical protein